MIDIFWQQIIIWVAVVIAAAYLVYFFVRRHNLKKDVCERCVYNHSMKETCEKRAHGLKTGETPKKHDDN